MISEITPQCYFRCPHKKERDTVVKCTQEVEDAAADSPDAEIVKEGYFKCDGPVARSIGPKILGMSQTFCGVEVNEGPQISKIEMP